MTTATIQTPRNDHTPAGRFAPGNKAAVGHSSHGKRLRAAILQALTVEDMATIVQSLVEQARNGDTKAAKLILDFVGKPEDSPATGLGITADNFQEVKNALIARTN